MMSSLRRSVAVILLSLFVVGMAHCQSGPANTVVIPSVKKGPALHGNLSDAVWKSGVLLKDFTDIKEATTPIQQTEARLLYDAKYLYIGVRCSEPNLKGLSAQVKDFDGPVWQDDCIEIFLDTANARHVFYHIMVNCIGTVSDEKCLDVDRSNPGWNSNSLAKTGRLPGAWTLEVAIPLKQLGIAPTAGLTWGVNICRARPGAKEYSAWSPTPGGFVQPQNFGQIVLGDAKGNYSIRLNTWGSLDADTSFGGRNVIECMIPATGHTPEIHDVSLLGYVNGKPSTNIRRKVYLTTGKCATMEIPYKPSGSPHESFVLTVSRDGQNEFKAIHPSMSVPHVPRVWQLKDPLFKELLSKTPPGDQKNGSIYWFHSGIESNLNPFAKEYGLRFSLDEAYKELVDARFMPITQTATLKSDLFAQMQAKYPFKILFQPDYRGSRDKGAPQINGLPYILDPRSKEAYFSDLRTGIQLAREHIWAIYTQDEMHDKATEQGVKFFSQMKDSYPFIREVDEQVKKEFGYGKYGVPESPADKNPFRWIAYRKWVNRQLLDWQKETYEVTKQLAPEMKVVSMDPVAGHNPFELDRWTPYIDIATHQLYPSGNPNRQEFGFVTKWVADLTGKPVWPCAHVENYAYATSAEETRELMSQVMRNGGKGFHLYIPDVRGGGANSGDTYLTKYGSPERYRAIREILNTTYTMNEVSIPTDPDCAIFYSEDHYQSFVAKNYVYPNEPEYAYTFLGPVAQTWFKFVNDNMVLDGRADLSQYKAVFVPAAKYERRAVVEELVKYVENGGTLVLGGPDCFLFAPDGSSLDDLRQKLIGASSASGDPPVMRNRVGKGMVITFTTNPFTEKAISDPKWKSAFKTLAKNLGLKTDRDIWRFKFPPFKNVIQPDPTGVCLTGNFIKWHQEKPFDICNIATNGKYSYSIAPEGVADRVDLTFGEGKLTDRKRAPSVPKSQLKPDDFIVTWKAEKPVAVTFDFGSAYPVNKLHLWYSGQLPALTVEGSMDGKSWVPLAQHPKQVSTEDVLDASLTWTPQSLRYLRLSLDERDPRQPMTLVECEVWAESAK